MTPSELADFDGHLASCAECRDRALAAGALAPVAAARRELGAAAAAEFAHPEFEEVEAFVKGELGDVEREIFESHLSVCALCADDVRDLQAFREEMPAAVPPPPAATPEPRRATPRRLRDWLRLPWPVALPAPYAAAAAALALVALAATLFVVWNGGRQSGQEVAGPRQQPTAQSTPAAEPTPADAPSQEYAAASPTPAAAQEEENGGGLVEGMGGESVAGLEALGPEEGRAVRDALTKGRVDASAALAGIGARRGTLMGGATEGVPFALVGPVGVVVRASRPALAWRPLEGGEGYTVIVLDSDGDVAARSPRLEATSWVVPGGLRRGEVYTWQVTAHRGGEEIVSPAPPAPAAKFKLLSADEARTLEAARRASASRLVMGVLYARYGLLEEAERELRAHLAADPRSAAARSLLRDIQRQRRRPPSP